MKVVIHSNHIEWQTQYLPRFTAGFVAHGFTVVHSSVDKAIPNAINVIFANNSWKLTHRDCLANHIPLITVGRCFFGSRHDMVAIGWDGFNGEADFCLNNYMPDDRWIKHGIEIPGLRWKEDGFLLVCGEFRHAEMDGWYAQVARDTAGEDVRFRPHPFVKVGSVWPDAPQAGQDDIASVLSQAKACITFDSIAGCDAVFNGCPSVTYGPNSAARMVSWHDWKDFPDRFDVFYHSAQYMPLDIWANRLAYQQWSHDEITEGKFWEHLQRGFDQRYS